jgi:RNA polymerase sigma factor (sigma-70 family)
MARASAVPLWEKVCCFAEASQASDRELLERFARRQDNAAFEQLVRRHGALVQGVCRRVLGNDADAEDAFQATFLALARKAGSTAWKDSVAGWLHRTAHQLACKARTAASRRARHEKKVPARQPANPLSQLTAQELLGILDEELLKLPERYRAPLILCYLQGATRDEAAHQLGCPPATLKSWLERGRQRLHRAAQRRGLTLTGVLGATAFLVKPNPAAAAVKAAVRTAAAVAAGRPLAGVASDPVIQLVEGGLRTMALGKWKATLALLLLGGAITGTAVWTQRSGADATPAKPGPAAKAPASAPKRAEAKAAEAKTNYQGRVVSPEGKPVPKAKVVFVRGSYLSDNTYVGTRAARAMTGADGRFQLAVPPAESDDRLTRSVRMLLATAPGCGPGWVQLDKPEQGKDATVKLVKDDVPLRGRVVDLDGKPIAGVSVRVKSLQAAAGEDLGAWEKHVRVKKDWLNHQNAPHTNLDLAAAGLARTVRTGADGRFRLTGFGRERVVWLRFSGPTIEVHDVAVRTRRGDTLTVARIRGEPRFGSYTMHGADFTHAAAPTRPVLGTVTDKATGKPLADVPVSARVPVSASPPFALGSGPDSRVEVRTDKDGRYRLVGLPGAAGQSVQAVPDAERAYLPAGKKTGPTADFEPAKLDFQLSRGIVIRGSVSDKVTAKPVRASVLYFAFTDNPHLKEVPEIRSVSPERTPTRSDGTFTLVGLPGRGIVDARVPDRRPSRYLVGVGAEKIKGGSDNGDFSCWPYYVTPAMTNCLVGLDLNPAKREATCHLVLDPGKTVTGTFVGPDGKPVAGVRIQGAWGRNYVQSGPLPTAQFTLPSVDLDRPQPYFFQHDGKKLGAVVLFNDDKTEGLTIKLHPCGTVTGRVLDLDGLPIAKATVSGYIEGGQYNLKHGWGGFFWTQADKNGRFRIAIIPGVQVSASYMGKPARFGGRVFQKLTLKPGQVHDVGEVKIDRSGD